MINDNTDLSLATADAVDAVPLSRRLPVLPMNSLVCRRVGPREKEVLHGGVAAVELLPLGLGDHKWVARHQDAVALEDVFELHVLGCWVSKRPSGARRRSRVRTTTHSTLLS